MRQPPLPTATAPSPRERLILALDYPSSGQSLELLKKLREGSAQPPLWVKVGLELCLAEGAPFLAELRAQGYFVFLDLKLHDIPNTVASALRVLASLDVTLVTVHAAGGLAMMQAAAAALATLSSPTRLLAVTVLTSMPAPELEATGVPSSPEEQVLRLARLAWSAGIHGLVASPLEAASLRRELGPDLHLVTPGIRQAGAPSVDDQQRIATPSAALLAGADQLVIGRPITRASDPVRAYEAVLAEIAAVKPVDRSSA